MRKAITLAITLLVLALPASASAGVRITQIHYKSSTLNGEYVVIKNTGAKAVTMTHWTLRDTSSHVFRFPTFKLQPGSVVRIHTGSGSNARHDLYWRSGAYIWNDDGDTAILKRRDGSKVDTCRYAGGGTTASC
jgi:P pilus assembly chaperone PapD